MNLMTLTLAKARQGLLSKKFSAVELAQHHITACEKAAVLNTFISTDFEQALVQAKNADVTLAKGQASALTGIVLGVKDLFCTQDLRTTAASRILENFVPPYESTITARLKAEGAVVLGKLNLDEFAMGSSNETSYFGPVINPWRATKNGEVSATKLSPGGSSGGSASAIAAGLCLGALGTDTGGSIRQPASFVGCVGMKPTYGRCSRFGIVAFASSLDQAGPLCKTVEDSAILLTSMAGYDSKDSTSLDEVVPDFSSYCGQSIRGLRIGIPQEYRVKGMSKEIEMLWQKGINWLQDSGAEIVDISLPHTHTGLSAYYIIAPAEASSNLARYDGMRYGMRYDSKLDVQKGETLSLDDIYERTRALGFGEEVRRRIMIGTYVLSAGYYDAYYVHAQKVRSLLAGDFKNAWNMCDAILTPTCPNTAFELGKKSDDPSALYINDVFTVSASLAGLPAISVPAGLSEQGLPLGLQIIGRALDEETVFKCAHALEVQANFQHQPQIWWGE